MGALETALRACRDGGGRAFVPYVTGGFPGVDAELLRSLEAAGADALEVGIPFSDPVMDGGVIQEASRRSLEAGTTPGGVLETVAAAGLRIPVALMTYVNPVLRIGMFAFLDSARDAGVGGVIVPDVPVDESDGLRAAAAARGLDTVLLAAPGTAPDRVREIAQSASGFVYCVSTYGVTGARERLSDTAKGVVEALRPLTDLPLLVGVGIGTPGQAAEACAFADGVVVGSALMQRLVDGDRSGALDMAGSFRREVPALDAMRSGDGR